MGSNWGVVFGLVCVLTGGTRGLMSVLAGPVGTQWWQLLVLAPSLHVWCLPPPSQPTLPSTLQRERSRMPVLAALRPSPRNAPSVSVSDLLTAHHGAVPTLGFRPHRCGELGGFLFLAGVLEPICFCASHNSLLLPALPEAWPCLLSALQRAIKTSWGNARKSDHYRKHQSPQ